MLKAQHVALERLRAYTSHRPQDMTEEEHAHIARCVACQELLGHCLAESNSEEDPSPQSK
jgi:hypothetical protein